MTTDSVY